MSFRRLALVGVMLGALALGSAWAAGIFPGFTAATVPLTGAEIIPMDTLLGSGQTPQTETMTTKLLRQGLLALGSSSTLTDAASIFYDPSQASLFILQMNATHNIDNPALTNIGAGYTWYLEVDYGSAGITPIWGDSTTNKYKWPDFIPTQTGATTATLQTVPTCQSFQNGGIGNCPGSATGTLFGNNKPDLYQFTFDGTNIISNRLNQLSQ